MENRNEKGQFGKGNTPKNKLDPDLKCIRAAVRTEIARVTALLTKPKSEADKVFNAKESTHLHEIMRDALKKKKFHVVQDFIDRTIGKPTQATQINLKNIPDDDLMEMLHEALGEMNDNN